MKRISVLLNKIITVQLVCVAALVLILCIKGSKKTEGEQQAMAQNETPAVTPSIVSELTATPTPTAAVTMPPVQVITPEPSVSVTPEPTQTPEPTVTSEPTASPEDIKEPENTKETIPAFAGMSKEFLNTLTNTYEATLLQTPGIRDVKYYLQTDERWVNAIYGENDTIGQYGCAPTSLAMVISTLTSIDIDPVQMCAWAKEKGYWYPQQGSIHTLIADAAKAFGLNVVGAENAAGINDKLKQALTDGKMVIVLMGKGSFTRSGHFIVLRGITEDGMIYVADPNSRENTDQQWELTKIVNEAKAWAGGGGPFWIIE